MDPPTRRIMNGPHIAPPERDLECTLGCVYLVLRIWRISYPDEEIYLTFTDILTEAMPGFGWCLHLCHCFSIFILQQLLTVWYQQYVGAFIRAIAALATDQYVKAGFVRTHTCFTFGPSSGEHETGFRAFARAISMRAQPWCILQRCRLVDDILLVESRLAC